MAASSSPARTRLRRVAALAAVAIIGTAVASPVAVLADEVSCGPQAPPERVNEFVGTWGNRMLDEQFLDDYTSTPELPADIAAEGFHDLDLEAQRCLGEQLAASLRQRAPGFGERLTADQTVALLSAVVFDRQWLEELHEESEAPPAAPAGPVIPTPTEQAVYELRETATTTAVPTETLPLELQTEPAQLLPAAAVADAVGVPEVSVPAVGSALPTPIPLHGLANLRIIRELKEIKKLTQLVKRTVDGTTYSVCSVRNGQTTPRCTPKVPYGTPVTVDTDGNLLPDATAQLALLPASVPGGVSLQFDLLRTSLALTDPSHVYAVFEVPTAEKRLTVGFDGRPSTLSRRSTATFTLESVLDALNGDLRVALDLKHLAPGSQSAVSFGAVEPGPKGVDLDPLAVFTTFAPVPEVFTVKARAQRRDGQAPAYTAQVISALPTKVTVQASTERTSVGDRRDIAAVLDQVPPGTAAVPSMRVDLTEDDGKVLVDYAGSGPIGSFSFSDKHTPSVAAPTTFETLVTSVKDIPLSLQAQAIAPFDVSYTAPTPVGAASVQLQETRAGAVVAQLTGTTENLTSRVRLVGDVTAAGDDVAATVTYDAADEIRNLGFQLFDDRDVKAQVDATVASLPNWMQVKLVKAPHDSQVTFDARSGPDAAPGSSSVGDIVVKYSSSGAHLTGLPAEDHIAMVEGTDSLQAALKYGGLSYVDYALHDDVTATDRDTVRAELRNALPRKVSLIGDTPGLSLNATVDAVPARMTLDYAQQGKAARVHYNASSSIDSITAAVREKSATAGGVGLSVTGVPDDLVLVSNPVDGSVVWDATSDVAEVGVTGTYTTAGRTWNGSVGLTSIPSHWELSYSPARYAFTAGTADAPRTVGAVHATLTNTGSVLVEPGNHAIVRYTEATGDLAASARLSDIAGFSYVPSADGFEVNAKAGGGKPFHVDGEVVMGKVPAPLRQVIDVDAHLASLPSDITIRQAGEVLDYTGNASYDIDAVVGIGRADALAATPAAPRVRGVALRDGRACDAGAGCANAMKVHAFLQGAPTGLHADLGTVDYGLSGYRPPAGDPTLNADVVMDDVPAAERLDVKATLAGLAPTGQDLHLGPLTTGPGSTPGSERIALAFTANKAAGPLTAQLTRGADVARFYLSNLPTTVDISALMEPQGITLAGTLAQPITRIEAHYRPTSMSTWGLTAGLGDVPTSFTFSQKTVGGGGPAPDPCAPAPEPPPAPAVPIINYTASADTLDLNAGLDLAMFGMSGSVLAGVVDLGRSVTGSWDGTVLSLASSPASGSISAHVPTAVVSIRKEFGTDDCPPSDDVVRFEFTGHIDIAVPIRNAGFSVTGLQSLVVRPGLSTGLQGDWHELKLGWSDIRTTIGVDLEGKVVVDFGGGVKVGVTLLDVEISELNLPINVLFHVAKNVRAPWMTIHSPVPCARAWDDWDWLKFDITLQPTSDRAPTWNAITLGDPTPAQGDAWIVTPNPYGVLPTVAVEGLAGLFSSPFDKGLGGDFRC